MFFPVISGTGYLTLDLIIKGLEKTPSKIQAGGSFGNVLTILSYLGASSHPIARLNDNIVSEYILNDLKFWGVNLDLIIKEKNGSSPVLIHRVLVDKNGNPKHKFEFKNPLNGNKFPSYRPYLSGEIENIDSLIPKSDVYYFDRVNRSAITLAKMAKSRGSLIYFEPSSNSYSKIFEECLAVADIVKFSEDRLPEYKEKYLKPKCALEIETNGKNGLSYRFHSNNWRKLESNILDDIIDSVGAGDWCSAGIIMKLSSQPEFQSSSVSEIEQALNYGQLLGAINCMFLGARGAMYSLPRDFFEELNSNLINKGTINTYENTKISNIDVENNILELIA